MAPNQDLQTQQQDQNNQTDIDFDADVDAHASACLNIINAKTDAEGDKAADDAIAGLQLTTPQLKKEFMIGCILMISAYKLGQQNPNTPIVIQ